MVKGPRLWRQVPHVNTCVDSDAATAPSDPVHRLRVAHFREMYDANYDDLWRYCLRRSESPAIAEEVLSDTFAVAWQKLDAAPRGDDSRPWLFGIARNHLRNSWRKRRTGLRLVERLSSDTTGIAPDDPAAVAVDATDDIAAALNQLKDSDRELLQLAAWEELPHREIAGLLGITENAVAIRLHRARERFAKLLAQQPSTTSGASVTESSRKDSMSPDRSVATEIITEKGNQP